LRCSKEKPTCKRCQSIPVMCTYPLPPDRRLLATQRARNRKPHICREPEDTDFQGRQTSSHVAGPDSALQETATLSPKMALLLIEIYFSRHWNAELMIHKASFIYDYLLNKVPDFLSLSIFALASKYDSDPIWCLVSINAELFLASYGKLHSDPSLTRIILIQKPCSWQQHTPAVMHKNGPRLQVSRPCRAPINLPSKLFKHAKICHFTGSTKVIRIERTFTQVRLN